MGWESSYAQRMSWQLIADSFPGLLSPDEEVTPLGLVALPAVPCLPAIHSAQTSSVRVLSLAPRWLCIASLLM